MLLSKINFRLYVNGIIVVQKEHLCRKFQLPEAVDALILYGYVEDRTGIGFKTIGAARFEPFEIIMIDEMPDYVITYQSLKDCDAKLHVSLNEKQKAKLWKKAAIALACGLESEGLRKTRAIGFLDKYRIDGHPDILRLPYEHDPEDVVLVKLTEVDGAQICGVILEDPEFFCPLRKGDKVFLEIYRTRNGKLGLSILQR